MIDVFCAKLLIVSKESIYSEVLKQVNSIKISDVRDLRTILFRLPFYTLERARFIGQYNRIYIQNNIHTYIIGHYNPPIRITD